LFQGYLTTIHSKFLTSIIGIVILVTAIGLLLKNRLSNHSRPKRVSFVKCQVQLQWSLTIFGGIIIGGLVAITSVGAGALGSIALLYLYPKQMTPNKLVGTDIAHAIPLALVAGMGYLMAGYVNLTLLCSLLLGSIPAAFLGSLAATSLSHNKLRLCLAAILGVSGLKLMF
ncbi:sulfite exporter TauE/SafE family protein, partial [Legionella londiniensis]